MFYLEGRTMIKIAIDAGHGSNTAGKRTPPMPKDVDFQQDGVIDIKKGESIREHYANVGVCVELEKELKRNNFIVVKSGWDDSNSRDDEDTSLSSRQNLIKKEKCDYSVSVHFNAYGDGKAFNTGSGVGTYYHSIRAFQKDSKKFAQTIQNQLIKGTKQKNRGLHTSSLAMCNCYKMGTKASILVELAFMTNEKEALEMVGSQTFWKECAVDICKGICNYVGKDYLSENEKDQKEQEVKKDTKQSNSKVINYGKLKANMNIRKQASTKSTIITVYKKGTLIEILEVRSNGWMKIVCKEATDGIAYVYNGKERYVTLGKKSYVVQKGDTLWKISKQFYKSGIYVAKLMAANKKVSMRIHVGEKILIP